MNSQLTCLICILTLLVLLITFNEHLNFSFLNLNNNYNKNILVPSIVNAPF